MPVERKMARSQLARPGRDGLEMIPLPSPKTLCNSGQFLTGDQFHVTTSFLATV